VTRSYGSRILSAATSSSSITSFTFTYSPQITLYPCDLVHQQVDAPPCRQEVIGVSFKEMPAAPVGVCSYRGCANHMHARGVCIKHRLNNEKKVCSLVGCNTNAQSKGLCHKHGGGTKAVCVEPGCTTPSVGRGRCYRHGGGTKVVCSLPDCNTISYARGLCTRHGGRGLCRASGCTTNAKSGAVGLCCKHGGGRGSKKKTIPDSVPDFSHGKKAEVVLQIEALQAQLDAANVQLANLGPSTMPVRAPSVTGASRPSSHTHPPPPTSPPTHPSHLLLLSTFAVPPTPPIKVISGDTTI
jgi:hypothetical protein